MASWMVHFRIADELMNYLDVDAEQFIVGNIGPDCGEPNEDWSIFTPSTNISHWMENEDKSGINSEGFYEKYIKSNNDISKQSFYLGYYVHLVTDILWRVKIALPAMEKFKEEILKNKKFIWTMKADWYDLDHKYLIKYPQFRAFRIFDKITSFPNSYLDYYSETAFEKRIEYISSFYNSNHENQEREYLYLSEKEMNSFVIEAMEYIKNDLMIKNIVKNIENPSKLYP